jgi:hypothetical protein
LLSLCNGDGVEAEGQRAFMFGHDGGEPIHGVAIWGLEGDDGIVAAVCVSHNGAGGPEIDS